MQNKKIYLFLFLFFSLLFVKTVFAAPIKTGTYELGTITDGQFDWIKSKFDTIVNSDYSVTNASTFSGFTGSLWTTYLDITTLATLTQYLDMVDWANANGVNSEEMLLHAKVDYNAVVTTPWQNIDQFDAFEGKNGVMLESGGVFTDKTTIAYSGASPYVAMNSNLYIGYELPFDQANFTFNTPAIGLSGSWQYWNGNSWTSLTVSDETSNFSVAGKVGFVPPVDWHRTSLNNSRNKYFIKFAYSSATTNPIIKTIKGDNWLVSGTTNKCRGWDSTSGTIVNSGELAYNATPPSNATAKFKYQARVPVWLVNHFVFNMADHQMIGGISTRTIAAYLTFSTLRSVNALPYLGMMYDDGISANYINAEKTLLLTDPAATDFADKTSNSVLVEGLGRYQDIYAMVKSQKPDLLIGLNAYRKDYVKEGDFNLYEYFNYTIGTGDQDNTKLATTDNATNMTYDDYLPENNGGKNIKGLMIYQDSSAIVNGYSWDQANRGPIVALAKHLIGNNDNTIFAYFTNGSAIYSERDDFYYTDTRQTTLTSALVPDSTSNSKQILGADFSAFDVSKCIVIGSGDKKEVIRPSNLTITKTNNTTLTTTSKIWFNHDVGEPVQFCDAGHFITDKVPSQDRIVRWANWFPAMNVDFGMPISARNLAFVDGSVTDAATQRPWVNYTGYGKQINTNVWSREYENALVLLRPNGGITSVVDFSSNSAATIPLGGTYYPLNADGTTGAATTSISLRRNEGAILMKAPVAVPVSYSFSDFLSLNSNWHHLGSIDSDLNSDNFVNAKDLGIMMSKWN